MSDLYAPTRHRTAVDSPRIPRLREFSVSYSDDTEEPTTVVLATVPAGEEWLLGGANTDVTEGFDGTSADIDFGYTGATAALFDGSANSSVVTSGGSVATTATKKLTAGQSIVAVVTQGATATAGAATLNVMVTRIL